MSIRILIADDHGIVRAGLRNLLNAEADLEVIREVEDGSQVLPMVERLRPDLVLMDISMPNMEGIEALRLVKKQFPKTLVIMLTVHEDEGLLRKAIQAGADGYVIKRAAEADLIDAIHSVIQGNIYIHPAMNFALVKDLRPPQPIKPNSDSSLTHRELEVLRLIAHGHTNKQIAKLLGISLRTVEGHRANVMDKLDLHSRVDLVEYAELQGWLD